MPNCEHRTTRVAQTARVVRTMWTIAPTTSPDLPPTVGTRNALKALPIICRPSWLRGRSRAKSADLIVNHKYGLHRRPNKHFGIAVAELVAGASSGWVFA